MSNYIHHRDYKTCEHCSSHLDHGERCDCQDTKCKCCGKNSATQLMENANTNLRRSVQDHPRKTTLIT